MHACENHFWRACQNKKNKKLDPTIYRLQFRNLQYNSTINHRCRISRFSTAFRFIKKQETNQKLKPQILKGRLIKKQETNENLKLQILKGLEAQEGEHATSLIDAAPTQNKTSAIHAAQINSTVIVKRKNWFYPSNKKKEEKSQPYIFIFRIFLSAKAHDCVCTCTSSLWGGCSSNLCYSFLTSVREIYVVDMWTLWK